MNKQLLLLAVALSLFACTQPAAEAPILNVELPSSSAALPLRTTDQIFIKGSGFTKACQLRLVYQDPSGVGHSMDQNRVEVNESGLIFYPETEYSGAHTLELRQEDYTSTIGTLYLIKETRVVSVRMQDFTPQTSPMWFSYTYNDQGVSGISCRELNYSTTYTYTPDHIEGNNVLGSNTTRLSATLQQDKVVQSTQDFNNQTIESVWSYSPDHYLSQVVATSKQEPQSAENPLTTTYRWDTGNLVGISGLNKWTFTYSQAYNPININISDLLMGLPLDHWFNHLGMKSVHLIDSFTYQFREGPLTKTTVKYRFNASFLHQIELYNEQGVLYRTYELSYK